MENGRPAGAERRRTGGLDADEAHVRVLEEAVEDPDRVRAAADAGDDRLGEAPSAASICSRASRPITDCSSATSSGYGAGPTHEPIR